MGQLILVEELPGGNEENRKRPPQDWSQKATHACQNPTSQEVVLFRRAAGRVPCRLLPEAHAPALLFQARGADSPQECSLCEQEQHDHRQREQDSCRHQQVRLVRVRTDKLLQPVGKWKTVRVVQVEQRTRSEWLTAPVRVQGQGASRTLVTQTRLAFDIRDGLGPFRVGVEA